MTDASFELGDTSEETTEGYLPPRRSVFGPMWEHQILYTDFEMIDEARLNALGQQRWELISMAPLPHERIQFVFRRPR